MPVSGSYYYFTMGKPTTSLDGGRMSVDGDADVGGKVKNTSGQLVFSSSEGKVFISGTLDISELPITNPHVTGSLWNDTGTVKVSGY